MPLVNYLRVVADPSGLSENHQHNSHLREEFYETEVSLVPTMQLLMKTRKK